MNLYLTLALVTLFGSILVFFSKEFADVFKKIVAIPGLKILLPLFIVSFLVEYYDIWLAWVLVHIKNELHQLLFFLAGFIPNKAWSLSLSHMLLLWFAAFIPIVFLKWIQKRRGGYMPWPHAYSLVAGLWVILALILTVHQP